MVLGGAVALLHLIDFDEPFGFRSSRRWPVARRSSPSTEAPCQRSSSKAPTGSVLIDIESAVKAVRGIDRFDRATVRAMSVQRFSCDRMVDEYVAAYRRAIAGIGAGGRLTRTVGSVLETNKSAAQGDVI